MERVLLTGTEDSRGSLDFVSGNIFIVTIRSVKPGRGEGRGPFTCTINTNNRTRDAMILFLVWMNSYSVMDRSRCV